MTENTRLEVRNEIGVSRLEAKDVIHWDIAWKRAITRFSISGQDIFPAISLKKYLHFKSGQKLKQFHTALSNQFTPNSRKISGISSCNQGCCRFLRGPSTFSNYNPWSEKNLIPWTFSSSQNLSVVGSIAASDRRLGYNHKLAIWIFPTNINPLAPRLTDRYPNSTKGLRNLILG